MSQEKTLILASPHAEQSIFVALLDGHTISIPPEGIEVPQRFRREALARGAVPVVNGEKVMLDLPADDAPAISDKDAHLRNVLLDLARGDDEDAFNADGTPKIAKVRKAAGYNVEVKEVQRVWAEVREELEGEG